MTIEYSFQSRQDLRDIYEYIAFSLLAPDAARNTSESIMEAMRSLESMTQRNPLYKEEPWHSQGIRFIPVKNFIVFYTVEEAADTVFVVRILYGARDISRQMEETTKK